MTDKYILDADRNVVPADLMEWARFFENADRIVRKSDFEAVLWRKRQFVECGLSRVYISQAGRKELGNASRT
jgi:hypothetical protein